MRIFHHFLNYPSTKSPLVEIGQTQESEPPWRKGKSLVLRRPFSTRAIAVGVWRSTGTEDDWHRAAGTKPVDWRELGLP